VRAVGAIAVLVMLIGATGCRGTNPEYGVSYRVATGGDPERGNDVIQKYRCGACHTIPGIDGADGMVGPPLLWFSRRTFIAGQLPNTPDNLIAWMRSPRSIEPHTAMPDSSLSDQEARDAAAYLYTLR
jgi:cytochrome c2